MSTRERTIVYSLLALLFAINTVILLTRSGSVALATELDTAHWAATPHADDLGPAASLTLTPAGEASDRVQNLELRNRNNRLSWRDSAHASAYSIGLVHVGKAMGQLVQADEYTQRRRDLSDELDVRNAELRQVLVEVMEGLRGMEPEDPQFQERFGRYQQLDAEYQQWLAEARMRVEQLEAKIITEAFDDFIAAVEVVAERRGVDMVHRFIPTDHEVEPRDRNEAQLLVRSRSVLVYPAAIDLTTAVLEELALDID